MSFRRRKSLLLFLVTSGCLVYYLWFCRRDDATGGQLDDQDALLRRRLELNGPRHGGGGGGQVFHADSDIRDLHQGHHHLDEPASVHHQRRDTEHADRGHRQQALDDDFVVISEKDLKHVTVVLHKHQAFLLDVDVLNRIHFINKHLETLDSPSEVKAYKLNILETFARLKQNELKTPLITYGVYLESLADLNDGIESSVYLNACNKKQMKDAFLENQVLTTIFLDCGSLKIQISVVYNRGSFLWIGSDKLDPGIELSQRFFGDTARAIQKFNLTVVHDERSNVFSVPDNLRKFFFDYEQSRFIECNRTLALSNTKLMGANYTQNAKRNKMISGVITHISDSLESLYKHYWLAGGTLLGWYRDCGIIPHTQDVDVAIWAHEYESQIKRHFLGNKIVRVWGTLGIKNDSYEFRLYNDQFTFDMFLVYKLNLTHQWCGYQVNRVKFRRFLPNFDELCSAELLEHKFLVPCDPVSYLNKEYGPGRWLTPQSKNYTWTNVVYMQNWTDTLWPHTIKYYDKEGKPLNSKILKYVNTHLHPSKMITAVPPDDLE